jgi:hypothetical protein
MPHEFSGVFRVGGERAACEATAWHLLGIKLDFDAIISYPYHLHLFSLVPLLWPCDGRRLILSRIKIDVSLQNGQGQALSGMDSQQD